MNPFLFDPAFYKRLEGLSLVGLSGGYVDDLLRTESEDFPVLSQKTYERFQMGEDETILCTFSGFLLVRDEKGSLLQNTNCYLKLYKLHLNATFTEFRSMRLHLSWFEKQRT